MSKKKYAGLKMVTAEPMSAADAKLYNYRTGDSKEERGYEVTYEDGYKSWCPKSVFDKAYQETSGMTFGLAIELMKKGFKLLRLNNEWNDKWVGIHKESGEFDYERVIGIKYNPYFALVNAKELTITPYTPSQEDMLADDWALFEAE